MDYPVFEALDSQEELPSTTFLSLNDWCSTVKIGKESSITQKLKPMSFMTILPKYNNPKIANYGTLNCI